VATNAEVYLRFSAPGIPALLLALAGTGYLRGLQDTRTPLVVAVGTNVLNLGLELWFVYGLDLGIGASAVATVIAQWTGALVYLAVVARAVRRHDVPLGPDRRSLARLGRAGRDLVIRTAALRGALLVAVVVATEIGDVDLGAFQVAFQIFNLLALVLDAIAIAGQSMVAKALGAGDAGAARAMARRMIEWSIASGVVLAAVVIALRTVLPDLFSDDRAVVALAGFMLWHIAALQPAAAVVFALDGILIGAGDYRFLAGAMVAAFAAFGAAALAVLALDLGAGWLMATLWVLMIARLVPLADRFRQDRWLVTGR
jgi:putative MATE family efflux protein